MALERALEIVLEETRTKIAQLRTIKKQIKGDLAKEKERSGNTDKCVSPVRRER